LPIYPLKAPLRSLNRSSLPPLAGDGEGADEADATATELAGTSAVRDEPLPHNRCTAGDTGSVRSPDWNNERKIGSVGVALVALDAEATATGAAVPPS
jgi:hypothetical protein